MTKAEYILSDQEFARHMIREQVLLVELRQATEIHSKAYHVLKEALKALEDHQAKLPTFESK